MDLLFQPKNPLATRRKKGKEQNCLNCPIYKDKKRRSVDGKWADQRKMMADLIIVLPVGQLKILKSVVKRIVRKVDSSLSVAVIPDIYCDYRNPKLYDRISKHCSASLHHAIKEVGKPNAPVMLVGSLALKTYYSTKYSKLYEVDKLFGRVIPDLENGRWVGIAKQISTDSVTNRKLSAVAERKLFGYSIRQLTEYIGREKEVAILKKRAEYLYSPRAIVNEDEAIEKLQGILDGQYEKFVAFDYETTGLKPYRKDHVLYTCGFATSMKDCFAFMITPRIEDYLRKILTSARIPKVAANNGFEYIWTLVKLGVHINNYVYDCCLAAHIQDPRRGVAGVKFLALVEFGIHDYGKIMEPYLTPTETMISRYGANAINRITQAPKQLLLQYNAIDAQVEYWLAAKHLKEIR